MPDEPPDLEYEYRKQRYDSYLKERDAIRSESLELSGRYDKAILALAGGALALSITFLEKIAPDPIPYTIFFLAVAWLCLIASVLLELFALSTSQTTANEQVGILDEEYRQYLVSLADTTPAPSPLGLPPSPDLIVRLKARMERFNNWSRWLLSIGVFLLCTFSLLNLPHREKANKKEPKSCRPNQ